MLNPGFLPRLSMASKALTSTFLSSFSPPHHLSFFSDRALNSYSKPTPIVCKISPQSSRKLPLYGANFADSQQEIDGAGAASPTPGERFLERHRAVEAAKLVLKDSRNDKKKRDKGLKVSLAVASCYGCGAPLQTSHLDAPGFVDLDTYELKKKHHQLRTVLCGRCRLLAHGRMITAVGGNGGYQGGKIFVTAEQLREKLAHLQYEKALIVKLVDIVDFNGSFLSRVRDLAGAKPIILVVTKVDLLPKGTDLNCIGDWVVEATTKKKLNVLSIHLTSSKSLVGITGVVSAIQKEKKGRDVYILGSANVGKSAFVNALLKTMSRKDPIAAAAQRYKPIQSAVPGTTLGPIQINAFIGGGKLYDTPGVHLHHRLAAVVDSEDLPILAPQSRLKGQSLQNSHLPMKNETATKITSNALNGFSIFWGGLVRIDILKVLPETFFTFYGPKALQIHTVPTDEADEFYKRELGVLLTPPSGKLRADNWRGLKTKQKLEIKFEDVQRPPCDIAISGVGWIALDTMKTHQALSSTFEEPASSELYLAVHVPRSVEIFVRPPLPVGKAGAEWYQYRKLTEKEEEGRPKWYF